MASAVMNFRNLLCRCRKSGSILTAGSQNAGHQLFFILPITSNNDKKWKIVWSQEPKNSGCDEIQYGSSFSKKETLNSRCVSEHECAVWIISCGASPDQCRQYAG